MGWNEKVNRGIRDASFTTEGLRPSKIFTASRRVTGLAAGANADSVFIVGSKPVVFFSRLIGRSGTGVSAAIFRGPTYTGGTLAEVFNTNDVSFIASTIQLLTTPTVTAPGEQTIATGWAIGNSSNQGQGGVNLLGVPLYMLPNTAYLLRVTSLDTQAQDFSSFISWYEGDL